MLRNPRFFGGFCLAVFQKGKDKKIRVKTVLGQAPARNRFWRDFPEVMGGSEANFLEVCFGRIPYGNFHTKATSTLRIFKVYFQDITLRR